MNLEKIPEKKIERLIIYRKLLNNLKYEGKSNIFSHKLAELADVTPAQVRRDLMGIHYTGSPANGYDVDELEKSIGLFLDSSSGISLAIVGLGKLGRSLLDYCYWRCLNLSKIVAFDVNESIINQTIYDCKIYHVNDIEKVIKKEEITIAILTVPQEEAQQIADKIVAAGVKGILNYSPVIIHLPEGIIVENLDMMLVLEKVFYFAGNN
jgi:redox-sensing transcriptional repressor